METAEAAMPLSAPDPSRLQEIARQVRLDLIEMLYRAGSGHLGGSLSATEILVALFFAEMGARPGGLCWPQRDRFILSKGTALRPSMPFLDKCRRSTPVASANNLAYNFLRYEPKCPGSKSGFHPLPISGR